MVNRSPLASKAPALDLAEGLGTGNEGDDGDEAGDGQELEQRPLDVIQEQGTLHGDQGAEEDGVRDGCGAERLGGIADVATESGPLEKTWSA
jgi:hypothetical protein